MQEFADGREAGVAAGRRRPRRHGGGHRGERGPGRDDWASFLKLTGAIVCRSIVFVGLSAFISLYVRLRTGGGEVAGTAALFVLYLGGAVGTVTGGSSPPATAASPSSSGPTR